METCFIIFACLAEYYYNLCCFYWCYSLRAPKTSRNCFSDVERIFNMTRAKFVGKQLPSPSGLARKSSSDPLSCHQKTPVTGLYYTFYSDLFIRLIWKLATGCPNMQNGIPKRTITGHIQKTLRVHISGVTKCDTKFLTRHKEEFLTMSKTLWHTL